MDTSGVDARSYAYKTYNFDDELPWQIVDTGISQEFLKREYNKAIKGEVTGAFTLHGVTKTITTEVTFIGETDVPWGQHRAGFQTTFNIKRSDYGMDKLLVPAGDEIQITLLVEAMRVDEAKEKPKE